MVDFIKWYYERVKAQQEMSDEAYRYIASEYYPKSNFNISQNEYENN